MSPIRFSVRAVVATVFAIGVVVGSAVTLIVIWIARL